MYCMRLGLFSESTLRKDVFSIAESPVKRSKPHIELITMFFNPHFYRQFHQFASSPTIFASFLKVL